MSKTTFEKLAADNKHGLVRMKVLKSFTPHFEGEIAGFAPDNASDLYTAGDAIPVDEKGEEIKIEKAVFTSKPLKGVSTTDLTSGPEIPADWQKLHHLQRVKLAKEITGNEDIKTADAADAAILAEIERRAGAPS